MRFQVPQFIEVESKIFGPFTFKQFIYLVGGAGAAYLAYAILPFFFAILIIIPVAALSLALAFYKVNKRPFINIVESYFKYTFSDKLYIWKKKDRKVTPKEEKEKSDESGLFVPRLSDSKLKDIAWSLDVQESIYAGEEKNTPNPNN